MIETVSKQFLAAKEHLATGKTGVQLLGVLKAKYPKRFTGSETNLYLSSFKDQFPKVQAAEKNGKSIPDAAPKSTYKEMLQGLTEGAPVENECCDDPNTCGDDTQFRREVRTLIELLGLQAVHAIVDEESTCCA